MSDRKTIICDIDGTLLKHSGDIFKQIKECPAILDGVLEKFNEWDKKYYYIILITGRRESTRNVTERQLREYGLQYDQLIMGVGNGERIVINDFKPNSTIPTCSAINVVRNEGLKDVSV